MATLGSTNPYLAWHGANTKEHMALRNTAINNFDPETTYKLQPSDADKFVNSIEDYGQTYGSVI